ncbi:monocarboxylate transporter 4-like isoform X2 [Ylistrum balloti]|uniref:monocarboxylate transporter 4-like isoform X2 n=1 Tax=Ylistrum balloti TaxID=509963 RepID=UPI002905D603|nr:monocarboxylate transporter 4-like isoform X2 [Ylistrum balloti]
MITVYKGILSSIMVDRWSCRCVTVTGAFLFTIGLLICALPVSLDTITFSFGILAGIGSSLSNTTAFIAVGYNFKQRMNIANGISTSGIALGSLVMPPVVEILRLHYGNIMLFLILGCLSLQQVVMGMLYFPSFLEHTRQRRLHLEKHQQSSSVKSVCIIWLKILENASFICFTSYLCLLQLGAFVIYLHLPTFVLTTGFTSMEASYLLTLKGTCAFLARILLAALVNSDSYNTELTTLMFGTTSFLALASILLPFYGTSFAGLVMFCMICGFYSDSVFGILNALNAFIVGPDNFATATGMEFAMMGIGSFVGPTLVGQVIDVGGTYTFCFSVTGGILFLAGFLSLVSGLLRTTRHRDHLRNGDQVFNMCIQDSLCKDDENLHNQTPLNSQITTIENCSAENGSFEECQQLNQVSTNLNHVKGFSTDSVTSLT